MSKFIGILAGLILLLLPIYFWITNTANLGDAALFFLKGGLMWAFLAVGAVLVVVGLISLKD